MSKKRLSWLLASSFFSLALSASGASLATAPVQQSCTFEPNRGQATYPAQFIARFNGQTLALTARGLVIVPRHPLAAPLQIELLGENRTVAVTGIDPQPGVANYLLGDDPQRWVAGVPRFAKVRYKQISPGVDLVYYCNQQQFEHDFIVAPGVDPSSIRMRVEGASSIRQDAAGDLLIQTQDGSLSLKKPVSYQEIGGQKKLVSSRYLMRSQDELGFRVSGYDPTKPLIIDPIISFSTYLGGSGTDQPTSIAVDSLDNSYITGVTGSIDFPTQSPLQSTSGGQTDVFITKLDNQGKIVYSTYLGGSGDDRSAQIKVNGAGEAFVAGITSSTNFPTKAAFETSPGGGTTDAFVAKLNASGNALVFSSYLGGSGADRATSLDLDSQGNAYIAGITGSPDFPQTQRAFQHFLAGDVDGFVTKINPAGTQLIYSTYLGGRGTDLISSIAVNKFGEAYLVGATTSPDLPTGFSAWPDLAGMKDAFMVNLSPAGDSLTYISYYGGSLDDVATSVVVDPGDPTTVYIAGITESPDFPTPSQLPTGFGPGKASPFAARFKLPRGSFASAASPAVLAARAKVDDYDWMVPVDCHPFGEPDWDTMLKQFDKDSQDLREIEEFTIVSGIGAVNANAGLLAGGLIVAGHVACPAKPPGSKAASDNRLLPNSLAPKADSQSQPLLALLHFLDGSLDTALPNFPSGSASASTALAGIASGSVATLYLAAQTNDATLPVSSSGAKPGKGPVHGYVLKFAETAIQIASVNTAGGFPDIAQNTWIEIKGANLAPSTVGPNGLTWDNAPEFLSGKLPAQLGGVSVKVNGKPAYVYFVSSTQINVLTPLDNTVGPVQIVVTVGSDSGAPFTASLRKVAPSFLLFGATNYIAARHADFSLLGPASMSVPGYTFTPAHRGETILLYAVGFGLPSVNLTDGSAMQSGTLPALPVVKIGNVNANVPFAGVVSPGLYQFNVQVPNGVSSGDNSITVTYEGVSPAKATLVSVE